MFKKLTLALALLCAHNASYSLTNEELQVLTKEEQQVLAKDDAVAQPCSELAQGCLFAGILFATLCPHLDPASYYTGTSALFGMSAFFAYYGYQAYANNLPLRQKAKQKAEKEYERQRKERLELEKYKEEKEWQAKKRKEEEEKLKERLLQAYQKGNLYRERNPYSNYRSPHYY